MTDQNHEQFVQHYFDLFNRHQWQELYELYSENAQFRDPSLGTGIVSQTRQEFVEKYEALHDIFPDLRDEVVQVYPSGEKHVIIEFVSRGTAEDGSIFELPICTIFTLEDGKITADYTYYDNFEEEEM